MDLRPLGDRGVQAALAFLVGLVAAQLLLTLGAKIFFECANSAGMLACIVPWAAGTAGADIPAGLLHGLLADPASPAVVGKAVHARLIWMASVVLVAFVSVAATVFAVACILKEPRLPRWPTLAGLIVLIFASALTATQSDVSRELLATAVLAPTIASYAAGGIDLAAFAAVRQFANALVAGATVTIVIALAVRAALGPALDAFAGNDPDARGRLNDLRHLLVAGAAVLVSVLLTMAAWLSWPTAGLDRDAAAWLLIVDIAEGVGLYWGTVFTLSLVLAYVPSVFWLCHRLATADDETLSQGSVLNQSARVLQDIAALISPLASALLPLVFI